MLPQWMGQLGQRPFFLYLLPVFFVLHGFTESYYLVPVVDSSLLLFKYLVLTLVLNAIFFFVFRKNICRSSLFVFILLTIYFFFGAFHDMLKNIWPASFLIKYTFLLPFILSIVVVTYILLSKAINFARTFAYLNILFVVLIIFDLATLVRKVVAYDRNRQLTSIYPEFTLCDTCARPDVYLIVADEYAGEKTLNDLYHFDNSAFLEQLSKRKFFVIKNSVSNYNATAVSIASLLNLDYIPYEKKNLSDISMRPVYNLIDTNILVPFFQFMGYEFVNNSVFTVSGQPPVATQSFTPVKARIIASQTLTSRVLKDLGFYLINWGILKGEDDDDYAVLRNNEKIIKNIKQRMLAAKKRPTFSYSHLTMPHSPYYYDRNGKPYAQSDVSNGKKNEWREDHYLEYLQYTNGVLLDLIDFILKHAKRPPVIILISDHGFRHQSKAPREQYDFYNLNATFLPKGYSAAFYDNMSNLAYMRSLLNVLFNQHLNTNKPEKFYVP